MAPGTCLGVLRSGLRVNMLNILPGDQKYAESCTFMVVGALVSLLVFFWKGEASGFVDCYYHFMIFVMTEAIVSTSISVI